MDVLAIQTALNAHGFNPGDLDGIWGRRTILAVKAFQKSVGLKDDGIVGPLTLKALASTMGTLTATPQDVETGPLVWYEEAFNLIGTKEIEGKKSNKDLIEWAKNLDIDYKSDDVPWCGLFVAHCIGSTLPDEQLPNSPLLARSWTKFGEQTQPKRGAVLVFWRETKDSRKGHVGFYHGEDASSFHVLGGNQSDEVNIARISKARLLAARWPRSAAVLTGSVVIADAGDHEMSHKEA